VHWQLTATWIMFLSLVRAGWGFPLADSLPRRGLGSFQTGKSPPNLPAQVGITGPAPGKSEGWPEQCKCL